MPSRRRSALIVIDVQRGFDDTAHWGPRNNPACEDNVAALIQAWRQKAEPIVFVRHDSKQHGSRPSGPDSPATRSRMSSRASRPCSS